MSDLVLAITGASGSAYGVRLLEVLLAAGKRVHLVFSPAAQQVFHHELGIELNLKQFSLLDLYGDRAERLSRGTLLHHHFQDFSAGIASGSFRTAGMVICPCSMGTLGCLASGLSTNLIHRAADVHLKERRRLILVPRETPLGTIQLENMRRLSEAGAVILPAMPGFYHRPQSIADLIDFVVGRICDLLGIETELIRRWGTSTAAAADADVTRE
jgi:4-hydroxy-3-polyprenylbenzoate decarboxylase